METKVSGGLDIKYKGLSSFLNKKNQFIIKSGQESPPTAEKSIDGVDDDKRDKFSVKQNRSGGG